MLGPFVDLRAGRSKASCADTVGVAYFAISRGYPISCRSGGAVGHSQWHGRSSTEAADPGLFIVVYGNQSLRVTLESTRGRIFDRCALNVVCD